MITGVPPAPEDAGTVSLVSHWRLTDRFVATRTPAWPEVINAEVATLAPIDGAYTLDLRSVFCDERGCLRRSGDHYVYRDDDHLSSYGSRLMAPSLERVLAEIITNEVAS